MICSKCTVDVGGVHDLGNKIQNGALQKLVDKNLGFARDSDIQNMITEVAELAFQCLQNEREFRPTMKKVYEVLLGIQSKYYGTVKTDVLGDDSSLLKDESQILSPNSVTANWVSRFCILLILLKRCLFAINILRFRIILIVHLYLMSKKDPI
ncbi:hypothetical protein DCAR_0312359 [Daucus carota subsp. sativus]|uniref:Serine-threonine/tyrosine-protein kinase catalytic domain-containing protein n=1 Tax=Daucus carota subsp. sativus TaxID=79200 RepID=A0AAF0WRC0_DAUCS|nr:hypothetical protein DCAR_0312359 [Daucus carota subsp. sativus]